MVDTATGVWLDMLGELAGCKPRTQFDNGSYNYTDTQYRKIVQAKIKINNGGATAENVADAVRYSIYLTDDKDWDSVKDSLVPMEFGNANIFINLSVGSEGESTTIRQFIPAGVGLWVIFSPEYPFIVSDLTDSPVDPIEGGGCGDLEDETAGGELSYFI